MSRPGARSITIVVLLVALASLWPANAAHSRATEVQSASWVAAVKSWLTSLWAEAGCIADPSGRCLPAGPTTDNGCILDPSGGRCLGAAVNPRLPASPTTDNGCIIDPSGRCKVQ